MASNVAPDDRSEVPIKLRFPIDVDGQQVDTITIRRPKVKDSLKAKKVRGDEMERGIALLADLCTIDGSPIAPEHIHELDELDLETVQAQYLAFTGRSAD